ncbi:MAG: hypothetical protein ACLP7I_01190, partial [Limisphaerales bacterium]
GAPASRRPTRTRAAGETPALPGAICLWAFIAFAFISGLSVAAQTTNAPALADYSAFRLIADRNIFDPNRYAHATGSSRRSFSRSAPGFSLVGTMTYSNGMIAFFDGTESDYRKALALNGTIAGYQVKAITLNGVKLSSTNKPVELAVGGQMRWESGEWQVAGSGELPASTAGTETPAADQPAAPPSSSEANDVLKKLMQQREQEQK